MAKTTVYSRKYNVAEFGSMAVIDGSDEYIYHKNGAVGMVDSQGKIWIRSSNVAKVNLEGSRYKLYRYDECLAICELDGSIWRNGECIASVSGNPMHGLAAIYCVVMHNG